MAIECGALDANLAAAAGDDAQLMRELRSAFRDSLDRQIDLLSRARCDGNWNVAAMRIKGLAASFHADDLIALADRALSSAPGDPVVVRQLSAYAKEFAELAD
ncbi:Hpt domain-containing protein [Altererythrobacter sp. CAU 1778]